MSGFDDVQAVMIAEGVEEPESEEHLIGAWQHLINTGLAWQLQGWFGRTAQALIDRGICTPAVRGLGYEVDDGTNGQDRESYSDDQDRESYTVE